MDYRLFFFLHMENGEGDERGARVRIEPTLFCPLPLPLSFSLFFPSFQPPLISLPFDVCGERYFPADASPLSLPGRILLAPPFHHHRSLSR